jgi:hypothetical protein
VCDSVRGVPDLSSFDAASYEARYDRVASSVLRLRAVLAAAEARGVERRWHARRLTGEMDESRLVDAMTGMCVACARYRLMTSSRRREASVSCARECAAAVWRCESECC